MSQTIKLKKGFDIHLVGKAEKKVIESEQPITFAVKPTDFKGIDRPKMMVKEGDSVKAGTPLFYDRSLEKVLYTSPVSGEVAEIRRGEKRKILEVRLLADKSIKYESFKKHSVSDIANLSREVVIDQLTKSGVWVGITQRPFGIVADPSDTPKSIFISAFDSSPLAADYSYLIEGSDSAFQAGLDVIKKLTSGIIHLNIHNDSEVAQIFAHAKGVQLNKFSGSHPAGNVGVQIHHIDPINKGDKVWTLNPMTVVQIGRLFLEGIYDASRRIAISGSEVTEPHYVETFAGACIDKLVENKVKGTHGRYISGNVLTGENVGKSGYLGFYHNQVTVIPEGDKEEFLGWILPSNRTSFHRAFGLMSFLSSGKERVADTNTNGEQRNFVITGSFEKVVPMDILPTYLFKSIIANDYDEMEALGIYEVIEEDVALCEYIDVSKNEIQNILRQGIDLIRNS